VDAEIQEGVARRLPLERRAREGWNKAGTSGTFRAWLVFVELWFVWLTDELARGINGTKNVGWQDQLILSPILSLVN
jgi:hypothetical protein